MDMPNFRYKLIYSWFVFSAGESFTDLFVNPVSAIETGINDEFKKSYIIMTDKIIKANNALQNLDIDKPAFKLFEEALEDLSTFPARFSVSVTSELESELYHMKELLEKNYLLYKDQFSEAAMTYKAKKESTALWESLILPGSNLSGVLLLESNKENDFMDYLRLFLNKIPKEDNKGSYSAEKLNMINDRYVKLCFYSMEAYLQKAIYLMEFSMLNYRPGDYVKALTYVDEALFSIEAFAFNFPSEKNKLQEISDLFRENVSKYKKYYKASLWDKTPEALENYRGLFKLFNQKFESYISSFDQISLAKVMEFLLSVFMPLEQAKINDKLVVLKKDLDEFKDVLLTELNSSRIFLDDIQKIKDIDGSMIDDLFIKHLTKIRSQEFNDLVYGGGDLARSHDEKTNMKDVMNNYINNARGRGDVYPTTLKLITSEFVDLINPVITSIKSKCMTMDDYVCSKAINVIDNFLRSFDAAKDKYQNYEQSSQGLKLFSDALFRYFSILNPDRYKLLNEYYKLRNDEHNNKQELLMEALLEIKKDFYRLFKEDTFGNILIYDLPYNQWIDILGFSRENAIQNIKQGNLEKKDSQLKNHFIPWNNDLDTVLLVFKDLFKDFLMHISTKNNFLDLVNWSTFNEYLPKVFRDLPTFRDNLALFQNKFAEFIDSNEKTNLGTPFSAFMANIEQSTINFIASKLQSASEINDISTAVSKIGHLGFFKELKEFWLNIKKNQDNFILDHDPHLMWDQFIVYIMDKLQISYALKDSVRDKFNKYREIFVWLTSDLAEIKKSFKTEDLSKAIDAMTYIIDEKIALYFIDDYFRKNIDGDLFKTFLNSFLNHYYNYQQRRHEIEKLLSPITKNHYVIPMVLSPSARLIIDEDHKTNKEIAKIHLEDNKAKEIKDHLYQYYHTYGDEHLIKLWSAFVDYTMPLFYQKIADEYMRLYGEKLPYIYSYQKLASYKERIESVFFKYYSNDKLNQFQALLGSSYEDGMNKTKLVTDVDILPSNSLKSLKTNSEGLSKNNWAGIQNIVFANELINFFRSELLSNIKSDGKIYNFKEIVYKYLINKHHTNATEKEKELFKQKLDSDHGVQDFFRQISGANYKTNLNSLIKYQENLFKNIIYNDRYRFKNGKIEEIFIASKDIFKLIADYLEDMIYNSPLISNDDIILPLYDYLSVDISLEDFKTYLGNGSLDDIRNQFSRDLKHAEYSKNKRQIADEVLEFFNSFNFIDSISKHRRINHFSQFLKQRYDVYLDEFKLLLGDGNIDKIYIKIKNQVHDFSINDVYNAFKILLSKITKEPEVTITGDLLKNFLADINGDRFTIFFNQLDALLYYNLAKENIGILNQELNIYEKEKRPEIGNDLTILDITLDSSLENIFSELLSDNLPVAAIKNLYYLLKSSSKSLQPPLMGEYVVNRNKLIELFRDKLGSNIMILQEVFDLISHRTQDPLSYITSKLNFVNNNMIKYESFKKNLKEYDANLDAYRHKIMALDMKEREEALKKLKIIYYTSLVSNTLLNPLYYPFFYPLKLLILKIQDTINNKDSFGKEVSDFHLNQEYNENKDKIDSFQGDEWKRFYFKYKDKFIYEMTLFSADLLSAGIDYLPLEIFIKNLTRNKSISLGNLADNSQIPLDIDKVLHSIDPKLLRSSQLTSIDDFSLHTRLSDTILPNFNYALNQTKILTSGYLQSRLIAPSARVGKRLAEGPDDLNKNSKSRNLPSGYLQSPLIAPSARVGKRLAEGPDDLNKNSKSRNLPSGYLQSPLIAPSAIVGKRLAEGSNSEKIVVQI